MKLGQLLRPFLMVTAATSCSYWLFYLLSPLIWSFNHPVKLKECVPWIRDNFSGHSGVQIYVLYLFMFVNLGLALVFNLFFINIKNNLLKNFFIIFAVILSTVFLLNIGFYAPMADPATTLPGLIFICGVFLITTFLSLNYKAWWVSLSVCLFSILVCLFTADSISRIDYNYILPPAWRFLHGSGLTATFSQYDYLVSILVAFWMKFFPIETLALLGRISYLILFIGAYFFARNFFKNKQLACYLFISMVIVKVYGNILPPDVIMQVTPLRLDWWLMLIVLAYWKTVHHWVLAAGIGFLVIFHHTFGCIYAVSYISFILILFVLELIDNNYVSLTDLFNRCFHLYFRNLIIILIGFLLYRVFLQPQINIADFYRNTGMGFIQISKQSFYWYMPVIFALIVLLLIKNRSQFSQKFFQTSILLVSLAIGNSLYFFGRSQENNIINISAILLMVLFLLLDLVHFELNQLFSEKYTRCITLMMASMVILIISYLYAGRGIKLIYSQGNNIKNHRIFVNSFSDFESLNFLQLKTLTHYSPKIIFISQQDFFFYYFGKYSLPDNYQCYTCSWFVFKNYVNYVNDQLNKGFYIVVNPQEISANIEVIRSVNARYFSNTQDLFVISNNPMSSFDQKLWSR